MDYSTRENKMKEVLKHLYNGVEGGELTPEKFTWSIKDFNSILTMAQDNGYIKGFKMTKTKDGGVSWTDEVTLTQEGAAYLKPNKQSVPLSQTTNHFNITGNVQGSAFGTNATVNNNWSDSMETLKEYISKLPEEDKEIGNELVKVVETEKLEKGMLSKFSDFLGRHSELVELTGKVIVWSLANIDKLG